MGSTISMNRIPGDSSGGVLKRFSHKTQKNADKDCSPSSTQVSPMVADGPSSAGQMNAPGMRVSAINKFLFPTHKQQLQSEAEKSRRKLKKTISQKQRAGTRRSDLYLKSPEKKAMRKR